jgi:hypothetical protein
MRGDILPFPLHPNGVVFNSEEYNIAISLNLGQKVFRPDLTLSPQILQGDEWESTGDTLESAVGIRVEIRRSNTRK